MNFEEKMNKLEELVSQLENNNNNLEQSITNYTEAIKIIKECDSQLKIAEEKITKLVLENGETQDFKIDE